MWFNLKSTLTGERHQTLDRRIDRLQELLRRDSDGGDQISYDDFKDFASATGNGLIEIFQPSGERLWPSPSAAANSFPWPPVSGLSTERFVHVQAGGQSYWVVERPFNIGSRSMVLGAAAPESGNLLVLDRFWSGLIAAAPVLLLVSMAGGYWTSRRALRPVDRITAAARSIGIRNLSERLPVAQSRDELQRLAETSNDMLERLEIAVRKLKQFTADASHELRGPLSLTRTIAEVALRNPAADPQSRAFFQEIVEESAKTTELLEAMLELARADTEPIDYALEQVDLGIILEEVCAMARTIAQERGIVVKLLPNYGSAPTLMGNAASLRRLLWILLDNAIKYTPTSGHVDVSIHTRLGSTVVEVVDNGIGIAGNDLPRIFDRFYRADPSRSQVEGNGLGLSIAKWIADLHRAQIHVSSQEGQGSSFSVVFEN
jgi:signal transduction histidine kinase